MCSNAKSIQQWNLFPQPNMECWNNAAKNSRGELARCAQDAFEFCNEILSNFLSLTALCNDATMASLTSLRILILSLTPSPRS